MNRKNLFNMLFALCLSAFANKAYSDPNPPNPNPAPAPAPAETEAKLTAALKRQEELEAELAKLKKPDPKPEDKESDLVLKARQVEEEKRAKQGETKEQERAIRFNLTVDEFVKNNSQFLPEEIGGILTQANKERYDNDFEKASALKSAILSSYFAVQANIDSLTESQKRIVENWKALTKGDREKRSADLYEAILEPTIENHKKVKKAEEVARARAGYAPHNEGGKAYKDRIMKESRQAHLGEKA